MKFADRLAAGRLVRSYEEVYQSVLQRFRDDEVMSSIFATLFDAVRPNAWTDVELRTIREKAEYLLGREVPEDEFDGCLGLALDETIDRLPEPGREDLITEVPIWNIRSSLISLKRGRVVAISFKLNGHFQQQQGVICHENKGNQLAGIA